MIVLSLPVIWAGIVCLFSLANGLVYETEDAIIVEGKCTSKKKRIKTTCNCMYSAVC